MRQKLATKAMVAATVLLVSLAIVAGQQATYCTLKLLPCREYLNLTSPPPSSCCDPMHEIVRNDMPCLCNLFYNKSSLEVYGVNLTQAFLLAHGCRINLQAAHACNSHGNEAGRIYQAWDLVQLMALLLYGAFILLHL